MTTSILIAGGEQRTYGGFSDAALHLTLLHRRMFTRQVVYRWWTKRHSNGFPDAERIIDADGAVCEKLDLGKVEAWYSAYVPAKGGRPAIIREREEHEHVA